ncbi:hypothetical protein QQF64_018602 [Cirrhinus molitorella]|uniref:Uncharacterized protein n=1 Tax=Cirrhinus molitorella TaxID=172907 RepID=A0ABR3LD32_9TELE
MEHSGVGNFTQLIPLTGMELRSFLNYPAPTVKPVQRQKVKKLLTRIPVTVLHRDIRRVIVLLPAEEQDQSHQE